MSFSSPTIKKETKNHFHLSPRSSHYLFSECTRSDEGDLYRLTGTKTRTQPLSSTEEGTGFQFGSEREKFVQRTCGMLRLGFTLSDRVL